VKQRLGIVGGGQLGRMLILDAKKLGFDVTVIDPTPQSPAGQVADRQIVAGFDDAAAIRQLAASVDYLTFEIESAGAGVLEELAAGGAAINPSPKTLGMIKDKLRQKRFLQGAGIPVAEFAAVDSVAAVKQVAARFGYPLLLKARLGAYDGRGNAVIKKAGEIAAAWKKLGGRELYVERFVPFTKEVAVIIARSTAGDTAVYPVVETVHRNNICHIVYAPARVSDGVRQAARRLAERVALELSGAGVFAIEMFVTEDGQALVNEIAPRVHNSGHLTMEASVTSQFEQQVRAVTGLPLGATELKVPAAVMVNILGERSGVVAVEGLAGALANPGVSVHLYGKAATRPERKMGHITAFADTIEAAEAKALAARKAISI
jgi:5-(carboxyamino)imidazole ribonucleotide synthase